MKMLWFFQLRFCRAYDSAYDADFRFSLHHKLSCDSHPDSFASENQPLVSSDCFEFLIMIIILKLLLHEKALLH